MESKENRETNIALRFIAKSSFIVFIGIILSKVLTYAYRIVVARYFGPEVYGLLALALMVVGWFGAFSSLGLPQGLLRFIPLYRGQKEDKKINFIYRISLGIVFLTGLISAIIVYTLSDAISIYLFKNASLSIFLKIFSIMLPLSLISNVFLSVLQAFEEVGWFSFINNILQNTLKVLSLLIFIFLGFNSKGVALSYLVSVLGIMIFTFIIIRKKIPILSNKLKLGNKKKILIDFFSYSWPAMFSGMIASVFFWIDTFFIGFFLTVGDVGIYNAAIPIAMLLTFAPQMFLQLFLPLITREYGEKNLDVIKALSKQVNKWIAMINIPLFFLTLVFPGVIINFLFGSDYLSGTLALQILSAGMLVYSFSSISNNLISMTGRSKVIMTTLIFTGILNAILNFLFIPRFGINGAAFSTSLSYICLAVIYTYNAHKYTSIIPIRRKVLNILISAIIPLIVLITISSMSKPSLPLLVLSGILFSLIYLILIFKTKALDEQDKMILLLIASKLRNPLSKKKIN
ncbi:hypothetical protein COU60_00950 [Candidatus Pacearchaeota archaeon CG10_big_fil_rev_8_21_14_0_10_34_76]|nr:MAG: hypothetical protein COU60_00950 [Candidatus Pacearchaeota archaeon CG10_big_fil_rev_8_21_14_0_10_34_76]